MNDVEVIICIFAGLLFSFCITGVVYLRRQRRLQMLAMVPDKKPSDEQNKEADKDDNKEKSS